MTRLTLCCAAVLLGASATAVAQDTVLTRHLKDPVERSIALDRLAVVIPDDEARAAMDDRLVALGIGPESATPFTHGSVWLVTMPPARRTADQIRATVADLATAPSIPLAAPVLEDETGRPMIPLADVFVRFDADVSPADASRIVADAGLGRIAELDRFLGNVHRVTPEESDGFILLETLADLALHPRVLFAETDMILSLQPDLIPNDPGFSQAWQLENTGGGGAVSDIDVNAPAAWDLELGIPDVIVAVLDDGTQQNHPDINQLVPGEDTTLFNGDGGPLFPLDNHGTAVAGLISGIINNGIGGVGVAPGCRTIGVKVAYDPNDDDGWVSQSSWVADGLIAAVARGARITNSSFGMGSAGVVTTTYDLTAVTGTLHFASAGNGGDDQIGDPFLGYPSSLGSVQAVAAIGPDGVLTDFSNYGLGLQFAAPGSACYTTDRTGSDGYQGGDYVTFGGTSASCPVVAGVAALAWSSNPGLSAAQVLAYLQQSAMDLGDPGFDLVYGFGLPRADAAVILASTAGACPGAGGCYVSNGTPGCDDGLCCAEVCNVDPFCCNSSWDGVCADQAAVLCTGCGSPEAGPCFATGGAGCQSASCCSAVCAEDPFCCEVSWDAVCVSLAWANCDPENDVCSGSISLTTNIPYDFNTANAMTEGPTHGACQFDGDDQVHKDIWFDWTATCSGYASVSTCGLAVFDTKLAIYGPGFFGSSCPFPSNPILSGVLLACNDDADGCALFTSRLLVPVDKGTTYRIRVGGSNGASGVGSIVVQCGIFNDTCGEALTITDGATPFSTVGASTDGPAHAACDSSGTDQIENDIWFRYTATCSGPLTLSTCGAADFDTRLAVYRPGFLGGTCPNPENPFFGGVLIGCADDTAGCAGSTTTLTIDVDAGTTYRIRVGGTGNTEGQGTLTLECGSACPGDLDGNGVVDGGDLGQLLSNWGGSGVGDIDGNGIVDGSDLGQLLSAWGTGCP